MDGPDRNSVLGRLRPSVDRAVRVGARLPLVAGGKDHRNALTIKACDNVVVVGCVTGVSTRVSTAAQRPRVLGEVNAILVDGQIVVRRRRIPVKGEDLRAGGHAPPLAFAAPVISAVLTVATQNTGHVRGVVRYGSVGFDHSQAPAEVGMGGVRYA